MMMLPVCIRVSTWPRHQYAQAGLRTCPGVVSRGLARRCAGCLSRPMHRSDVFEQWCNRR